MNTGTTERRAAAAVVVHKGAEKEAKVGDENKQTRKPNRKKRAKAQTEYMEIHERERINEKKHKLILKNGE